MYIKEHKRALIIKRLLKRNVTSLMGISIYDMEYKDLLKYEVKLSLEEL